MKKQLTLLLLTILTANLAACSGTADGGKISSTKRGSSTPGEWTASQVAANRAVINLEGDSVAVDGKGASVSGTVVTITTSGTYSLQGFLNDGQIIVDAKDGDVVNLILDGASITSRSGAPLYAASADKVVITLADGSQNTLTDGGVYDYPDEKDGPSAAVFSRADLTFTGSGRLTVNANYKDGIVSQKNLEVVSGTITVKAVKDGIKGRDSVSIKDGLITIDAGADGIQATNADEADKGYISIDGGSVNIISSENAIRANDSVTINAGAFQMASSNDGIHAEENLTINGGQINLTRSYEGLESAIITINGGNIHLKASEDGINASGGADSFSYNSVYINGGTIFIDADGDGIDTNGSFEMTNGLVLINGPTDDRNGPLDYDDTFTMTGGLLVAVGSAGMAQAPSKTSNQYSVLYNFEAMQAAGTLLHIRSQAGQEILTYMPSKVYQSVVISSPALQNGETYLVFTGGSSTGSVMDGLYTGGMYTPGTQFSSFTISSVITIVEVSGGGGP